MYLDDLALALVSYIFLQFVQYVNPSKIYYVLFFALVVDFFLLINYAVFLKAQQEEILLYMPYLVLLALYTVTVFEINGWKNLLDYIYETVTGHIYHPISIRSLYMLWPFFSGFIHDNKNQNINGHKLFLAITILVLNIFKEILKKNYIIILILIYQYNSPFIFWLWFNHLFLFIILISLLPIDSRVVMFISEFFGDLCFAWLGFYQTIKTDRIRLNFRSPSELRINKKKDLDLQSLEKNIQLIHTLLNKLKKKIKK